MTKGHAAFTWRKGFAGLGVSLVVLLILATFVSCAQLANAAEPCVPPAKDGHKPEFTFSWYGPNQGTATASGEEFRPSLLTAAHRKCPFGTRLRVTYRKRSVVVRVNDRGPYVIGRYLDISEGAARSIGLLEKGIGRGSVEIVK